MNRNSILLALGLVLSLMGCGTDEQPYAKVERPSAGVEEPSTALEKPLAATGKDYSPYVDQHFPRQLLFGDTHHHSSFSVDSGLIGNRLGPDVGFRLARGEEITTGTGQRARLIRPLDFLVISDHAEYLGIADLLNTGDPALLATDVGQECWPILPPPMKTIFKFSRF